MSRAEDGRGEEAGEEDWPRAIAQLRARIQRAFDALAPWLDAQPELLDFHPRPDSWSVGEVCEHVTLTNRYLLILARKIGIKSGRRLAAGRPWPDGPPRFEHLERLGARTFRWERPEHMAPTGRAPMAALCEELDAQRAECLALLARMPGGEGTLHRIRMSAVEGDDRLDLYQYLAVVALHLERHVAQMERNARELAAR